METPDFNKSNNVLKSRMSDSFRNIKNDEMINNSPSKTSFLSATFNCDSTENSDQQKENYNPETLSEIADRTVKQTHHLGVNNQTSTPKNLKYLEKSSFDLDDTLNATCDVQRAQQPIGIFKQADISMSFLTDGFNNMGIVNDTVDVCNVTSDEDESFVSFTDSQGNNTIMKDDVEMAEIDIGELNVDSPAETITIKENDSVELAEIADETVEILSPSSVNDRTFDQVELESKESSSEHASPEKIEELNDSKSNVVDVLDETFSEQAAMSADLRSETDDDVSVMGIETLNGDFSSTKPVEDEFDGNATVDVAENPRVVLVANDGSVNPFSPNVRLPSSFIVSDAASDESHEQSAVDAEKSASQVFQEKFDVDFDVEFKMPAVPRRSDVNKMNFRNIDEIGDNEEFQNGSSVNFSDSDFDYIEHFGGSKRISLPRDSVLLNFDPLCSKPSVIQKIQRLGVTQEEPETKDDNSFKQEQASEENSIDSRASGPPNSSIVAEHEMSMMKDLSAEAKIDINHSEDRKFKNLDEGEYREKMAELENKIKQEAEMREEALLKRISEKDKQITKMNGVVEAYEKAISELIAEKEQLSLAYDKKCNDLKHDSEMNSNHLESLEATFSDLHSKYERTKQMTQELYDREKTLVHDRKALNDSLKMQEARYDKMKSHAMAQLEIANNTLAEMNRNHQAEVTRLKALLKKEEIARGSINEQLLQKSKENSELVKICDELINGTQAS